MCLDVEDVRWNSRARNSRIHRESKGKPRLRRPSPSAKKENLGTVDAVGVTEVESEDEEGAAPEEKPKEKE